VIAPVLGDPATLELIVVVDGSDDGTYDHLQDTAREHPKLQPMWQENAGEGRARQAGLEQARGDVVLFLDDDVIAGARLVSGHAAAHAAAADLVVLGYMPPAPPVPRRPGQAAMVLYCADYERMCNVYERDPDQVLLNLWAGNVSIGRENALRVGMTGSVRLDYHADKDFGMRCRALGLHGRFIRSLRATHDHQRTLAQFRVELERQMTARRALAVDHPDAVAAGSLVWTAPPYLRRLLALLAGRRLFRPWSAINVAVITLAGRAGLWNLETVATRVLRQIDLEHWSRT
jgi:glycosyltransferase involved in cell wall biosynthesis